MCISDINYRGNLFTYASWFLGEHRAVTILLHRTRFWQVLPSSFHLIPIAFNSSSTLLRHVCLGLPTFLFPWGFQLSDCLVVFVAGFRRVWPIHPHFLLFISVIICSCPVLSHSSSLGIIPDHLNCSTFLRHLFMNVCSLFVFVFVTRHVSETYNRTDFTFVQKILILFCREREVALQMGRRVLKACLALFILFLISSSVPPIFADYTA